MLHDWEKVLKSPVFTNGFKPMDGHDAKDKKGEGKKEEVSEHASLQMEREEVVKNGAGIEVVAH